MTGAELVVREQQVGASRVHRDRTRQVPERDDGTLDVPAGSASPEHRIPGWLSRPLGAPEQRIEWIALAGPLGVSPALRAQLEHGCPIEIALPAQMPVGCDDRAVEIDVRRGIRTVYPVGNSSVFEFEHGLCDRGDFLGDGDVVVGRDDAQALHVAAKEVGLLRGKHAPVDTVTRRSLEKWVVDIRRVLHIAHVEAGVQPEPDEGVEGEVSCGVTEVGGVVRRYAAHVNAGDSAAGTAAASTAASCGGRACLDQLPRRGIENSGDDAFARQTRHCGSSPGLH